MNSIWGGGNVDCFHCEVEKAEKMLFSLHLERLSRLEEPGDQIFKRTGFWCSLIGRIQKKNPENSCISLQSEVRIRKVLSIDVILKLRARSTLLFIPPTSLPTKTPLLTCIIFSQVGKSHLNLNWFSFFPSKLKESTASQREQDYLWGLYEVGGSCCRDCRAISFLWTIVQPVKLGK